MPDLVVPFLVQSFVDSIRQEIVIEARGDHRGQWETRAGVRLFKGLEEGGPEGAERGPLL